jgi:hypothetical protein
LDADVHVRVRVDGQRVAERGWSSIVTSFARRERTPSGIPAVY